VIGLDLFRLEMHLLCACTIMNSYYHSKPCDINPFWKWHLIVGQSVSWAH